MEGKNLTKVLRGGWMTIVLVLLSCATIFAQSPVQVTGMMKIYGSSKKMTGVTVTLTSGGSTIKKVITSSNGKFEFQLPFNKDYKVTASKPGWVAKNITISTKGIPAEEMERGGFVIPMELTLFEEIKELDVSILNQPIGKFAFDPSSNDIVHDPEYTSKIQNKLRDLMKEYERKKKEADKEAAEAEANALAEAERLEESEGEFNKLMEAGDDAMTIEDFNDAVANYQKALDLIPNDQIAKSKLADAKQLQREAKEAEEEMERIAAELLAEEEAKQKAQENFDLAVKEADRLYKDKEFEKAKAKYENALTFLEERYPKDQIKECDARIAEFAEERAAQEKLDAEFKALMDEAAQLVTDKSFEDAIAKYQAASDLKPSEKLPKDKISETRKLWDKAKDEEERLARVKGEYDQAIAAADGAFTAEDFERAKNSYLKASELMPEEQYPKDRLKETQTKLDELAAALAEADKIEADYQAAIKEGDRLVKAQKWEDAVAGYQKASDLKPDEQYPKDQIALANGKIAEAAAEAERLAALEEEYNTMIAKADEQLASKEYQNAVDTYKAASELKPGERYPKDKIAEAEGFLDLDANYASKIASGDEALAAEDYATARTAYEEALKLKSGEQYPTDQLASIDKILADLEAERSAAEKLEADYQAAIKEGDRMLKDETWEDAKGAYQKALDLKPDEQYPKDQIALADQKLADLEAEAARLAEVEQQYKDALAKADGLFDAADYPTAIAEYRKAAELKPDERYPKDRIEESQGFLNKDAQYAEFITTGDNALAAEDFSSATTAYEKALKIKEDQYPKDKIAEIQKILADREAEAGAAAKLEEDYQAAIKNGDRLLKDETYDDSKAAYQQALDLKPDEQYPKDQIAAIDKILSDQLAETERSAALEQQYKDLIAKADGSFDGADYAGAIADYRQAAELKPDERYPKDRITEAQSFLESGARYDDLIKTGDNALTAEDFSTARTAYEQALELKDDQYPKDKIAEIAKILADREAEAGAEAKLEADYQAAIKDGDRLLQSESYEDARTSYQKALDLKPAEGYPKDQIASIDRILADANAANESAAALNKQFDDLIAVADTKFDAGQYEAAITEYGKASDLKPDARYPKDKITAAREKLDALARYDQFISSGEGAIESKDYGTALTAFQSASDIKPTEQYPKDKIDEVKALLAGLDSERDALAATQARYEQAMKDGDRWFNEKDYGGALDSYRKAADIKPDETLPAQKIAQVEKLMADLRAEDDANAALDARYKEQIAQADALFDAKDYSNAINSYRAADDLKPMESYPDDRIRDCRAALAEIDRLAMEEERRRKREEAAARADALSTSVDRDFGVRVDGQTESEADRLMREAARQYEIEQAERMQQVKDTHRTTLDDWNVTDGEERLASKEAIDEAAEAREGMMEGKDDQRKENAEDIVEYKEVIDDWQDGMVETASEDRIDTKARFDEVAVERTDMFSEKDQQRVENADEIIEYKETIGDWQDGMVEAEFDERVETKEAFDDAAAERVEMFSEKDEQRIENADEIVEYKETIGDWQEGMVETAFDERVETKEAFDEAAIERTEMFSEKDEQRVENADEIVEYKETIGDWQEGMEGAASEDRVEIKEALDEAAAERTDMFSEKDEQRVENADEIVEYKETIGDWQEGMEGTASEDRVETKQGFDDAAVERAEAFEGKDNNRAENAEEIIEIKEAKETYTTEKEQESQARRQENYRVLGEKETFRSPKSYDQYYLNKLAQEYAEGISEESYTQPNKIIIRRVVVKGNKADDYHKSISKWGTYYFKNGISITKYIWDRDTNPK